MRHTKKHDPYTEKTKTKNQATETACESDQTLDLKEWDFKLAIRNMFSELKESMVK